MSLGKPQPKKKTEDEDNLDERSKTFFIVFQHFKRSWLLRALRKADAWLLRLGPGERV